MKQLSNHEEFVLELHKEKVIPPNRINTKGQGQLKFECGCGKFPGINDHKVAELVKMLVQTNNGIILLLTPQMKLF